MKAETFEKARALSVEIEQLKKLTVALSFGAAGAERGRYAEQGEFSALRDAWAQGFIRSVDFAPVFRIGAGAAFQQLAEKTEQFGKLKEE